MLKYTLYGDGIHDDTNAIQEMIDSGTCEVTLPVPKKLYLISKPLVIPSNFKLKLPRYAEIKLADGANCFMLQNKAKVKPAHRLRDYLADDAKELWKFYDVLSPDKEDTCHDFEIEGGIWNFNNLNQDPNPIYTRQYDERNYLGHVMFFYNVRNFRISNMTFKDPANYAVMIDTGSYFTIENIMDKLNTKFWFSTIQESSDENYGKYVETMIRKVEIPVKVVLGVNQICVSDWVNLQCGDIIRLDTKTDSELSVYVGNIKKFTALPGTSKDKYAVRVTSVIREEE